MTIRRAMEAAGVSGPRRAANVGDTALDVDSVVRLADLWPAS